MMKASKTEKGWVNINIDIETKKIYASSRPYKTKEDAEMGIFIGPTIQKVACIEIEWTNEETLIRVSEIIEERSESKIKTV